MADSGSSAAPAGGSLAPATIQDSCGSTPKKPRLQHAEEAFAATFAGQTFPAKYACQVEGCDQGMFAHGHCDEHLHDIPEVLRHEEVEAEEKGERSDDSDSSADSADYSSDEEHRAAWLVGDDNTLISEFRSTVRAMCRSRMLFDAQDMSNPWKQRCVALVQSMVCC